MSLSPWFEEHTYFLQFGGQGSSYLQELANLASNHLLKRYFQIIYQTLETDPVRSDILDNPLFPRGLDIQTWLATPEKAPDEWYLSAAPISMLLIGLTQLAHFFLFLENGFQVNSRREVIIGTTGHSQGLASAVFAGLGLDNQGYYSHLPYTIQYLFYLGVSSQQGYGSIDIDPLEQEEAKSLGLAEISPMVVLIGPSADEIQTLLSPFNQERKFEDQVFLSLLNTPDSHVISARPKSHLTFFHKHREFLHEKKWRFVPIMTTAPFHAPLLQHTAPIMAENLRKFSFSYQGKDLGIPVFSIFDGRNLQTEQGELAMIMYKEIIIQELHWRHAVAAAVASGSQGMILDFGPGRVSGRLTAAHLRQEQAPTILSLANPKDARKIYT